MLQLKVKRLHADAIMPGFAHPDDSGMDVCSVEDLSIAPGAWAKVPTGLSFELPAGTELQVRPRSGLAAKFGISVVNAPGTVDEGYRGEVCVLLINLGSEPFHVEKGMRVAQLVLCPVLRPQIVEAEELGQTARGEGGFGSSGV